MATAKRSPGVVRNAGRQRKKAPNERNFSGKARKRNKATGRAPRSSYAGGRSGNTTG